MAYTDYVGRTDAAALIPEAVIPGIIQGITEQSTVLRIARRLSNMPSNKTRMPVLSQLPSAYFVDGDTGLKQTTKMKWENKYINAEEIACIVPIPEAVLDDAEYDMWGEIQPRIVEAFGVTIDAAILFGVDAPDAWPDDVSTGANSAGNSVTLGTGADLYDDLLDEGGVISCIEEDGFMATGHVAAMSMRGKLRGLRDAEGTPLFMRDLQGVGQYALDGDPIFFPRNGVFDEATSNELMISGAWNELVYSMRREMTWKILDQAVLTNAAGEIVYNLPQQDMVALRAVMRLGWQIPNPINLVESTEANRYPFARLVSA